MDHQQAIELHASMRYALGELTAGERDSFEEHFADCSFCMKDVETSMALAANARAVFRERPAAAQVPRRSFWFPWRLSPAFAFSAALNLALVAGLGYQMRHVQPAAVAVANSAAPQSVAVIAVHGATRGEGSGLVYQTPRRPVVLTFDLPQSYQHYLYTIARGDRPVMSGEVKPAGQPDSLGLQIPADRLAAGEYRVTLTGSSASGSEILGTCRLRVEPN
ncbi:MAG TPA: anti-sigma factor [Bryobacteraceae bacterium]|nr:anti-sigma factor [Bryobacteraceae bacterium]